MAASPDSSPGTVPKILAFAGSTRRESFNKKLVKVAAEAARQAGAEVTYLDLKDYPLPVYDGDLETEQGIPENAVKLKKIFLEHQGLLMSCPEYNSSISGVLKNTIDWMSRTVPGEKEFAPFLNKVAAILSASPGGLGGLRGLVVVRMLLQNIQVMVIPGQLAVSRAHEAFQTDGTLKDAKQQASVERITQELVRILKRLN